MVWLRSVRENLLDTVALQELTAGRVVNMAESATKVSPVGEAGQGEEAKEPTQSTITFKEGDVKDYAVARWTSANNLVHKAVKLNKELVLR